MWKKVYLQSSAHVKREGQRLLRAQRVFRGVMLLLRPSSLSVAVCTISLTHSSRHRWHTSNRSPVEAYTVVQVAAITIRQRAMRMMLCSSLFRSGFGLNVILGSHIFVRSWVRVLVQYSIDLNCRMVL